MAAATKAYGLFFKNLAMGNIPWKASGGAALKVALLNNTYTPNQDTHEVFSDVSAAEITGATGYTAGGVAVTPSDPAYDAGTNVLKLDCSDAEWAELTATARYAVLYVDGATKYLVAYHDNDADKTATAEPFKVRFSADGAVKITIA